MPSPASNNYFNFVDRELRIIKNILPADLKKISLGKRIANSCAHKFHSLVECFSKDRYHKKLDKKVTRIERGWADRKDDAYAKKIKDFRREEVGNLRTEAFNKYTSEITPLMEKATALLNLMEAQKIDPEDPLYENLDEITGSKKKTPVELYLSYLP